MTEFTLMITAIACIIRDGSADLNEWSDDQRNQIASEFIDNMQALAEGYEDTDDILSSEYATILRDVLSAHNDRDIDATPCEVMEYAEMALTHAARVAKNAVV